jgi:hypothetical protein
MLNSRAIVDNCLLIQHLTLQYTLHVAEWHWTESAKFRAVQRWRIFHIFVHRMHRGCLHTAFANRSYLSESSIVLECHDSNRTSESRFFILATCNR